MPPSQVLSLLGFLDNLFGLAGKLVLAAMEKEPILKTDPLNDLVEVDEARKEALKRVEVETILNDNKTLLLETPINDSNAKLLK